MNWFLPIFADIYTDYWYIQTDTDTWLRQYTDTYTVIW